MSNICREASVPSGAKARVGLVHLRTTKSCLLTLPRHRLFQMRSRKIASFSCLAQWRKRFQRRKPRHRLQALRRFRQWLARKRRLPRQQAPVIRFEDATDKAGIDFTHSFGSRQLGSLLEGTGAGCVWFDYNNSAWQSLYVVNGRPLDDSMHPYPLKDKPSPLPHNHLYRNDGNGHFTDVTEQSGLNPDMYSIAVTAADYDNDGFEDLLVTGYGKVILYHNDGNGHFTDVTAKAGIKVDGWAISSTWLDYDKDGCVDLFVGRYVKFDPKYRAFYAPDNYPGPLDYEGETNMLFHNNCDGTFTDVTEKSGIGAYVGRTMGVTAADFDNDGWDDIYVANDRTENFLFHNKHDGTFEEIANDTGTAFGQNGESTSSMGPVFADFEGRGLLDLWVTDGHYNRFLRNTGKLSFEDVGASNGISQANAQYVSWGTGVYDFDNDGQLDILIFHGGLIHLIPQEHTLFRGLGNGKFADVSRQAGPVLSNRTVARGACFADYDNDGKVDAFVVNLGGKGTLLHNVSTIPATGSRSSWWAQRAIATALARGLKFSPRASGRRRSAWPARVISRRTTAACTLGWARQPPSTS
jgi:hypothetical protein